MRDGGRRKILSKHPSWQGTEKSGEQLTLPIATLQWQLPML